MSRELFKSMNYRNGKVYTRQCSNNVYPKHFYSEENIGLTKQYDELGQANFEKWFITNGLITGTVEILGNSNKVLRRLNYLCNLLWKDNTFQQLYDIENYASVNMLLAKTEREKELTSKKYKRVKEDIASYISSFYDIHNSRFKDIERLTIKSQ